MSQEGNQFQALSGHAAATFCCSHKPSTGDRASNGSFLEGLMPFIGEQHFWKNEIEFLKDRFEDEIENIFGPKFLVPWDNLGVPGAPISGVQMNPLYYVVACQAQTKNPKSVGLWCEYIVISA